ncbi:pyridoxal phosphate-dependent aminotransferase [Robbsia sp. KACC 23696]|uniref:pyridoxal phosphate-dependent aminotransferase n=1 Tax=Robbsia sp. KACC 23696 TaxID=3149231 RepID=UPI00325C07D0
MSSSPVAGQAVTPGASASIDTSLSTDLTRSPAVARAAVANLRASKIREVANAGFGLPDVLPFWFGESNQVTPAFIREAASAALADGHVFYTHNLGIAPLREALADYVSRLHGPTHAGQIAVTSAGVSALMLATQLLVGPGDRVVAVTPLWPNLVEMPKIVGATVDTVSLDYGENGWALDIDALLRALTPGTRMVLVNSPNNPTGWTMPRAQQAILLDHCRTHGIWILADEVYERLYYGAPEAGTAPAGAETRPLTAPSFLDLASRDERVIVVNSFSKAWLMTGWRLGWVVAPASVMEDWGKLAEYNTSCAPDFVQRAGMVAVQQGEAVTAALRTDMLVRRQRLFDGLSAVPGVDVKMSDGAMYLFFRIAGHDDSLALCKALVRDARIGLAPGAAFGEEGEGFIRWCYASDVDMIDEGVRRLAGYLR